jgi:hypothetical protein
VHRRTAAQAAGAGSIDVGEIEGATIEVRAPAAWSAVRELIAPRPGPGVQACELDGEAVLFNPQTQTMHMLNATAWAVWRRCDGRTTIGELAASLAGEYALDPETARDHVEQLVTCFGEARLFVEENSDDSPR